MSGSRQTSPLFYPVRQLHHVCRVDAEEDVKDFRPLRPGLDPPEIVVLFLCPERSFHRSRPHSGKLLSDKVFLLFLLTERTVSFYERCLYLVRLAVVPVFSSRIALSTAELSLPILPALRRFILSFLTLCSLIFFDTSTSPLSKYTFHR